MTARVGIAAECIEVTAGGLTCQFVSLGISDKGTCVVSTWSERLREVRRTSGVLTWAGTRGPEGLAGAVTRTSLVAEIALDSKRDFLKTSAASVDKWSYRSTTSFAAPEVAKPFEPLTGKLPTAPSTEVKSTSHAPALRCQTTAIMAVSPLAEDTVSPRMEDK